MPAHTPKSVLAKNFGRPESAFDTIPKHELYTIEASMPGPSDQIGVEDATTVRQTLSDWLPQQEPERTRGGTVRLSDTRNLPASTTTSAALVEVEPEGTREMHGHPNSDVWQYCVDGQAHIAMFVSSSNARSFRLPGWRRELFAVHHE